MENLRDKYRALNDSFGKTLVFHVGAEAGFFSEFNNMICMMLYCLEHGIRFTTYSRDANFARGRGLGEYFGPWAGEATEDFHRRYNFRYIYTFGKALSALAHGKVYPMKSLLKRRVSVAIAGARGLKRRGKFDYWTWELWRSMRHMVLDPSRHYHIPVLGIDGNLGHACSVLAEIVWQFNPETQEKISTLRTKANLPAQTDASLHIRGGDKFIEAAPQTIGTYLEKLGNVSGGRRIGSLFLLTDDYRIYEELRLKCPGVEVCTLCGTDERGYFHGTFSQGGNDRIIEAHLRLFASVEQIRRSEAFVGTFSSNPGIFIGMLMENSCGVDYDTWRMW